MFIIMIIISAKKNFKKCSTRKSPLEKLILIRIFVYELTIVRYDVVLFQMSVVM